MGLQGCSPRPVQQVQMQKRSSHPTSKSDSVRNVEGIVKDYLSLVAKDYISNDVTESYRIVKKKRMKRNDDVRVDLSHCKYELMRNVIRKLGWQEALDERPSHLYWTDSSIGPERLMALRHGQKVNHFFGMLQICRKKSLARHLSTMRKMFPAEYRFFPRAYILPNQLQEFLTRFSSPKLRTYILKPDNGSQGKGVALVQNISDVKQAIGGFSGANMLAQKYVTHPMLINGYKFDLRIYTLILSCEPLRLYLYREGLVRFCTVKYSKPTRDNLRHSCMHLTNYSLNKLHPNFEFNDNEFDMDRGSKWSLSGLYRALAARGHDTKKLKRKIKKMVVMTFIAIAPYLSHNYHTCLNEDDNGRSCFEILGLDVLVDEKCKPWLLEVNHSPSFSIDTPLDLKVKEGLLSDTLALIHVDPTGLSKLSMVDRKNSKTRLYGKERKEIGEEQKDELDTLRRTTKEMEQYEADHIGNFDLIYPCEDDNLQSLYNICLAGAQEAFKHSFDMKVKKAIEKVQEERKQEALDREMEEKKKMKQRAQLRKRAQESARLVAMSRIHSEAPDVDESLIVKPPQHLEGEEEQTSNDAAIDAMELKSKQLQWNPAPSSLINSPQDSPRKDIKLSPRCLPVLPGASTKKVAWESTLRNDSPYGNCGFIRPQVGLLPPIHQVMEDGYSPTSPRLKGNRRILVKRENTTPTNRFTFWSGDELQPNIVPSEKQTLTTTMTTTTTTITTTTKLPELKGRNRSISPFSALPLRTLPTARFIFDEPEQQRASDSGTKWNPKLQINDVVKALRRTEFKKSGGANHTAGNQLHVCHICKPIKRIPKYESYKSRRSLREFLVAPSADALSCTIMEPTWSSSEPQLSKEIVLSTSIPRSRSGKKCQSSS